MDIKSSIDLKTSRYTEYNLLGNNRYDYARYGILNKCLPKILFKGNSLLVSFLQAIDVRLVMMFKWIDKLKHFTHITWY